MASMVRKPGPLGFSLPYLMYSWARSLHFTLEFQLLNRLASFIPSPARLPGEPGFAPGPEARREIREALEVLLKEDAANIAAGVYPPTVLKPESPLAHFARIPFLALDGLRAKNRRQRGRTTEFSEAARELLDELPRYYRRNFHFQTDGYLSRGSAELYEHQVELLFQGAADPMRRLIIPAFKRHFGDTQGEGLTFLEIGAGTGRATRFMSLAFPKARIVATDLSGPYLRTAQSRLRDLNRVDFLQADGAKLPFQDGQFDAAYSVFLYHELPLEERKAVLRESARVVKPGGHGMIGLVDSIQMNDRPRFNAFLENFSVEYHEPFYRNYIAHPMDEIVRESAGVDAVEQSIGFFSKLVWAKIGEPSSKKRAGAKPAAKSKRRA